MDRPSSLLVGRVGADRTVTMAEAVRRLILAIAALLALASASDMSADPVITSRPRLIFNAAGKSRLIAKKNANDPSWQAL